MSFVGFRKWFCRMKITHHATLVWDGSSYRKFVNCSYGIYMFSGDSNALILQWHCEVTGEKKMSTGEIILLSKCEKFAKKSSIRSMYFFKYLKNFTKNIKFKMLMKLNLSPIPSQGFFFTPTENRKSEVVWCFQEVWIGNTGFKCVKVKYIVQYIKQCFFFVFTGFSAKVYKALLIMLIL